MPSKREHQITAALKHALTNGGYATEATRSLATRLGRGHTEVFQRANQEKARLPQQVKDWFYDETLVEYQHPNGTVEQRPRGPMAELQFIINKNAEDRKLWAPHPAGSSEIHRNFGNILNHFEGLSSASPSRWNIGNYGLPIPMEHRKLWASHPAGTSEIMAPIHRI